MKCDQLRDKFLEFFHQRGHKIFPSDSLVPEDTTLLFTSAGMNQFKPYFLGEKKDVKRAASCQKCLRTDDLEKVGKTPYHHTFFEMLGNFSFGDYFKEEAISFAWEFLTRELNLKEERLWVSVYKEDEEAFNYWRKVIGVNENKIVRLDEDTNFWPSSAPSSGPDGPCGPCSEIFFDKGKDKGCGRKNCNPSCDCGRFVEVWNLVFTQFNRKGKNNLLLLPQKNIDTGMGLERVASILQGKETNFEIDILSPVGEFLQDFFKSKEKSLINAIVDYVRAASFAISDGVFPSNEERGYVVRKLIRRALWLSYLRFKKKPYLYKLVPLYAELMKKPYPELFRKQKDIAEVILSEEEKFLKTLEAGKNQLEIVLQRIKEEKRKVLSANEAFKLYDTYGFPLEFTKKFAEKERIRVDEEGFCQLLEEQRRKARKKSMFDEGIFVEGKSIGGKTEFVGYKESRCVAKIVSIFKGEERVSSLEEGEEGVIVLDRTCFYPESGGQLSDKGRIECKEGVFIVEEVKKIGELIVHKGRVQKARIVPNMGEAFIDQERRTGLARAHTATHLLQAALRKILGTHVTQQGSLVDVERLRFDFTHFKKVEERELEEIEELVNSFILRADKVEKEWVTFNEAIQKGALAFFKEKYQDRVRVVSISDYSKELCGGTHLNNTSEVGMFCITAESSVSSGIRRIEAVVGKLAYQRMKTYWKRVKEVSSLLKSKEEEITSAVYNLYNDFKKEKTKRESLEKELLKLRSGEILKSKKEIEGISFITYQVNKTSLPLLLYLADILRQGNKPVFVFLVSQLERKNFFVCGVTTDLAKRGLSASCFVSRYKEVLSLKGGGRDITTQGVILTDLEGTKFRDKVENLFREFILQCK